MTIWEVWVIGLGAKGALVQKHPSAHRVLSLGSLPWRPRGLSKSVISRVKVGVTPFRVLKTLLITDLLSLLGL